MSGGGRKNSARAVSSATENIDISDATKTYLEHLITKSTEALSKELADCKSVLTDCKKELAACITKLDQYDAKFEEYDRKFVEMGEIIDSLKTDLNASKHKAQHLENRLGVVKAANDHLVVKHDDLENYGRRLNVRVEGIPYEKNETEDQLLGKIKSNFAKVDIVLDDRDVVRYHRSAKPRENKQGTLCAQTIIKLVGWKARRAAHYANKLAREKKLGVRFHNDLTKRRYLLLAHARGEIDRFYPEQKRRELDARARDVNGERDDTKVFAYCDVNSNLVVRRGKDAWPFNTEEELGDILEDLRR